MIVVDVNVVAYLFIDGERTKAAEAVLNRDSQWSVPLLWRSEWRSILAGYLRRGELAPQEAMERMVSAERLLQGREHLPDGGLVLELVLASSCSAYDCEYVALAEALGVPLVTADSQILADFPGQAISLEAFVHL